MRALSPQRTQPALHAVHAVERSELRPVLDPLGEALNGERNRAL